MKFENRLPSHESDELHFYKARIYANCKNGDDRLQVRILPFMAKIEETNNLPKYPPFVRGKVIRGFTEKDDGKEKASLIYVLATSDFTFGYVLDTVNNFAGALKGALDNSWSYKTVKALVQRAGAIPKDADGAASFKYENICVDINNENATYLEFHDMQNGAKFFMTCKGDILTIQPSRIYMCARSGPGTDDKASYMEVRPTSITFVTDTFDISKAKNIILGHHGMKLVGTVMDGSVAVDGFNMTSMKNIQV